LSTGAEDVLHNILQKILAPISHNVPAVYDVLPARIKGFAKQRPGPEQWRGNGAKRNDLAIVEAEPPTGGEA
jgi:hypothetical protein